MGKKRTTPASPPPRPGAAVTLERAARLFRLLQVLNAASKTRAAILRRLKVDIRTFYRDLELLREHRIHISLERQRYTLEEPAVSACLRLPIPDPGLNLGELKVLARGRTTVHQKLKRLLAAIER